MKGLKELSRNVGMKVMDPVLLMVSSLFLKKCVWCIRLKDVLTLAPEA
jgi:hypothetical protein